jgi:ornithine carbamoyltransferase
VENPEESVQDADLIYTDTYVSMGDEGDAERRTRIFARYQINKALLSYAPETALVMHCLPAHPGLEITAEVLRSARSIVFDQAENRTYIQQALILILLGLPSGK